MESEKLVIFEYFKFVAFEPDEKNIFTLVTPKIFLKSRFVCIIKMHLCATSFEARLCTKGSHYNNLLD